MAFVTIYSSTWSGTTRFVSSDFILGEFHGVLIDKIGVPQPKVDAPTKLIRHRAVVVTDASLDESISRDSDDDWILAVAASSTSTCLITGDDDLLSLGSFRGIKILRPSDFWEFEIRSPDDL